MTKFSRCDMIDNMHFVFIPQNAIFEHGNKSLHQNEFFYDLIKKIKICVNTVLQTNIKLLLFVQLLYVDKYTMSLIV